MVYTIPMSPYLTEENIAQPVTSIQWATKMKEKTDVNYYSGDKIDDPIKNTDETIEYEKGVHPLMIKTTVTICTVRTLPAT